MNESKPSWLPGPGSAASHLSKQDIPIIRRSVAVAIGAAVSLLVFSTASTAATATSDEELQEVVITGSSIAQDPTKSSLPVTVLTSEDIAKSGLTTASDLVQNIPAMQGFVAASSSVNGGGAGQTTAALHSLPSKYTVVLVDGQRVAGFSLNVANGGGSAVNLESIPLSAVERVEVLTDGASALYGADAVAGVVNLITKKNTTEGTAFYNASVPERADGGGWTAGFSKGFGDLANDGYNLLVTYSHDVQDVLWASDRDASKRGAYFPFTSGGVNYLYNGRTSNTEPGNFTVNTSGGSSYSFNPYYTLNGNCGNANAAILDTSATNQTCRFNYAATVQDIPPSKRDSGMLKGTFNVGEDSEVWAQAMISQYDVTSQYAPPAQPLGIVNGGVLSSRYATLYNSYVTPYLTANGIDPADVSSVTLGYRAVSAGGRADDWGYQTRHIAMGYDTKFAGWDFKAALILSHSKLTDRAAGGYLDGDLFATAIANGSYDPVLSIGQSALKQTILHSIFQQNYSDLNSVEVNAQHNVFDLPGGTSIVSVGGEYAWERSKTDYSDLLLAGNGTTSAPNTTDTIIGGGGGAVPFEGDRTHWGAFGEWLLPVLPALNVTASARYDSYAKVHSDEIFSLTPDPTTGLYDQLPGGDLGNKFSDGTYKVSFRWAPIDLVAVRGSIGTGFKVPEIGDISGTLAFNGSTSGSYLCPIPGAPGCLPGNAQYDLLLGPNGQSGANGLKPEKSTQYTFGVNFAPVTGLSLGLDYWNVRLKNQIESGGIAENIGFGNPAQYASLFVSPYIDPVGGFTTIAFEQVPFNGGTANYTGIDWNFSYVVTSNWGAFSADWTGTQMLKQNYTYGPGLPENTDLGVFGPDNAVVFRTQSQLSVSLKTGNWGNTLTGHYKSGYTDISHVGDAAVFLANPDGSLGAAVDFCCLHVGSYTTFDWQTSFDITKVVNLTAGIKNLTDKDPPLTLQNAGGGNQTGYDGRYADPIGRAYYLRANYKF